MKANGCKTGNLCRRRKVWIWLVFTFFILGFSPFGEREDVPFGKYIFDYPSYFGNRVNITAENPVTMQGVYLGRRLFYEPRLSTGNLLSCGSCHKQERAFTDGKKFSLGVDGTLSQRNTMPLVNLLWARKFFWDGRASSLEEQAFVPMQNPHEMGQALSVSVRKLQQTQIYPRLFKAVFGDDRVSGERIVMAIAQFERTLISSNSRYDRYLAKVGKLSDEEVKGMVLFNTSPDPEKGIRGADCAHCHGGPKNYMELFHNKASIGFLWTQGLEC